MAVGGSNRPLDVGMTGKTAERWAPYLEKGTLPTLTRQGQKKTKQVSKKYKRVD